MVLLLKGILLLLFFISRSFFQRVLVLPVQQNLFDHFLVFLFYYLTLVAASAALAAIPALIL